MLHICKTWWISIGKPTCANFFYRVDSWGLGVKPMCNKNRWSESNFLKSLWHFPLLSATLLFHQYKITPCHFSWLVPHESHSQAELATSSRGENGRPAAHFSLLQITVQFFLLSLILKMIVFKNMGLSKKEWMAKKVKQRNITTAAACLLEGLEGGLWRRSFSAPFSLSCRLLSCWKELFLSPSFPLISFFFPSSFDLDEDAVRRRFSPISAFPPHHWPRHSILQSLTALPQSSATAVLNHTQVTAWFSRTLNLINLDERCKSSHVVFAGNS